MIELVDVYTNLMGTGVIELMYVWLGQRTPEQSISHKTMPTMEEHRAFVLKRPYPAWYLIKAIETNGWHYVGNAYLTERREIGIHIDAEQRGTGWGSKALQAMRSAHPGPMLANINPENTNSIAFFKRHGARLLQHTYEL